MYAKLFSRIAQSSLMEEKVTTRYVFMMFLALSDRHGDVIGTDIAISRMMNISKEDFIDAIQPLLNPDPDSNSPNMEGRRITPSEVGRGYRIVNYVNYRDIKSDEEKREYMREYMRKRRQTDKNDELNVNPVKLGKDSLIDVTHAEVAANADSLPLLIPQGENEGKRVLPLNHKKLTKAEQGRQKVLMNNKLMKRIGKFFNRKEDKLWTIAEAVALQEIDPSSDDVNVMESYYLAYIDEDKDHRRKSLMVLLNNWSGELDRANVWKYQSHE